MALLNNGFRDAYGVFRYTGGPTPSNGALPGTLAANWKLTGAQRNFAAGEGVKNPLVGIPSGYRHPAAWVMPQKPGLLSARNTITGAGSTASTGQAGYNIEASISGSGDIPPCQIGLIVSIAAAIAGSGGVSSATIEALATMAANLTGAGNVVATAQGLADLAASIAGAGAVNAGNTALMDIEAQIRGYGDLTPEGIRDKVWTALLASYPEAGSAGLALSTASSGGVDLNALAAAVWAKILTNGQSADATLNAVRATPIDANMTHTNGYRIIGGGIPPTYANQPVPTNPGNPFRVEGT